MKLVLQMNQNDGLLTYLSTINPQKSPSINRCNWNGSSSALGFRWQTCCPAENLDVLARKPQWHQTGLPEYGAPRLKVKRRVNKVYSEQACLVIY
jgi:hypothetical protein